MNLKCKKCDYVWDYSKNRTFVSCPECRTTVRRNYLQRFYNSNGKCEECGSKENLEIHHIVPRQKGIDNDVENIKVLCNQCHRKIKISNRMNKDRNIIQVNITYEDSEYITINDAKQLHGGNWHDFLSDLCKEYLKKNKKGVKKNE